MNCSSEPGVIAAGAGALPGARRRCEAGTRTHGRATRTCLALLAATALLALAAPAQAQTAVLISNFNQAVATGASVPVVSTIQQMAQGFTTGSSPATLTSIDLKFYAEAATTELPSMTLHSGSPTGTQVAILTSSGSLAAAAIATFTFTAPANTTLTLATTYFLVLENTGSVSILPIPTKSDAEESGGATGWSIADVLKYRFGSMGSFTGDFLDDTMESRAVLIRVNGTVGGTTNTAPTVANTIQDQTATVGTALSYAFPANTFADTDAGDTLTYTATKSDDSALPSWLSFAASTRMFSGTPTAADVGTVSVKVTASDGNGGSVSDTFDIVVSAAAGVTVSKSALTVTEEDTTGNTYTVVLDTLPTANVTVTVAGHGGTDVTLTPSILTFTTANWNLALTVTVKAGNDTDTTNDTVTLTHSAASTDSNYGGITIGSVVVTVADNDSLTAPGAPTGLAATANGPSQIDLSWTAPATTGGSAITGYKIEVSPDGSSWSDLVADTASTDTAYAHVGLDPATTRHYRVSAINTQGTGTPSNVDSATTDATAPGAPTGLTATASGATQIDLSWTAPASTGGSAITGYKIEVSPNGTSGWTDLVANTSNTTTTYAHTGLTAGDTRHYRVSAINTQGTGTPSNVDSATTGTSVPGAPTGLAATASGTTAIDLSWSAPASTGGSAITGYKIESSSDGGSSWSDLVANTASTDTAYAHVGLDPATTRHYRVSAINANGTGTPSNVDSATTGTTVPGAPTGLTATASGTTAIDLSWTAPATTGGSAITGYKIEVSPDGSSWSDLVADTASTDTAYAHVGLDPATTRHYRVSAINTQGTGTPSNVDSATTDATAPGAPTGLTATASGATQIDLSWTAPASTGGSAITGYKIEVSPNGTSGWTDLVANTSNTTTTYAHTGLTAGDTRHYRVSAINTQGTGTPSNVDSATTDATAPGAPTGLTATASGATQIDLSWTAPASTGGSAITGYKIEVSPNGTSGWTDLVASNTTTTYAHTGLTAGDTRHYRGHQHQRRRTPSNVDSATTGTTVPGAPTGLTATERAPRSTWSAPASTGGSAITGYKIEVSPNGAGPTRSPTPAAPTPPTRTWGSTPATPATTASPPSTPRAPAPPPTSTAPPPAPPCPALRPASRPRPAGPPRSTSPGAPRRAPAAPPSPATKSRSRPMAPPAGPTSSPTRAIPPPPTRTPG